MVRGLADRARDELHVRLPLGERELSHRGIDLPLGDVELPAEDAVVEEADADQEERPADAEDPDQRLRHGSRPIVHDPP